jgi:chromosome segregation ATPase
MRRVTMLSLFVVLCLSAFLGCETTNNLKGKLTSKVSSMTSSVDEDLFAQVPEDEREGVEKAAFALKVSEEKLKLAELKIELADLQKKHAGYEEDLTDKLHKEAQLALDLAKLEAIDRSELGEKEDNIKKKADLRSKKLGVEAERVKIEAKVATSERHIDQLTEQIEEQKKTIEALETGADLNKEEEGQLKE